MEHDPRCRVEICSCNYFPCPCRSCDCDLIAKVSDQAIRECIAALLSVSVRCLLVRFRIGSEHWPYDETSDTYAEFIPVGSAVDAVRALLKGEKS